MPDRHLQRPFADVVVQRRPGHAQKERQRFPVPEHVVNAAPQGRVGLHQPLVELSPEPGMEFLHHRPALGLMEDQPLRGRVVSLLGNRVVAINHGQRLQHVAALFRKILRHVDELPPPVRTRSRFRSRATPTSGD